MDTKTYWENIYATKAPDRVTWYRAHLETSLALIERSARDRSASIIDVGGGESTLVDDLLALTTADEQLKFEPVSESPQVLRLAFCCHENGDHDSGGGVRHLYRALPRARRKGRGRKGCPTCQKRLRDFFEPSQSLQFRFVCSEYRVSNAFRAPSMKRTTGRPVTSAGGGMSVQICSGL